MKLNPDCIRDILLTIEESTTLHNDWSFGENSVNEPLLSAYSIEELVYHISQCDKSGLIDGCQFFLGSYSGVVSDLSPHGHQFLSDIRSDTVWNNIKAVSLKVGSNSLNAIMQIATGVITEIIKAQLGLTV